MSWRVPWVKGSTNHCLRRQPLLQHRRKIACRLLLCSRYEGQRSSQKFRHCTHRYPMTWCPQTGFLSFCCHDSPKHRLATRGCSELYFLCVLPSACKGLAAPAASAAHQELLGMVDRQSRAWRAGQGAAVRRGLPAATTASAQPGKAWHHPQTPPALCARPAHTSLAPCPLQGSEAPSVRLRWSRLVRHNAGPALTAAPACQEATHQMPAVSGR